MAQTMTAYKAGACAECGGTIAVGAVFAWGRERGQRVHADGCDTTDAYADSAPAPASVIELDFTGLTPAQTPPADDRVWSEYQERVFDFGVNGLRSGIIYGVAGCAKTTTLEEMTRRMPAVLRIKYLVFNKRNATEAQERMPSNVEASTFHSTCWSYLSRFLNRPKLDDHKVRDIVRSLMSPADFELHADKIMKLVGIGKNSGIGALSDAGAIDDVGAWARVAEEYGIEFDLRTDDPERADAELYGLYRYAARILGASNADRARVDFDDMLYLTVLHDVPLARYQVVCVDEAQDTNPIQRAILHRMLAPGGRLIAVGDPRQAIYHFRGASADAMDRIRDEFSCHELPLSVNYRCSRAVIDAAQRFCPQIEAWAGAPDGTVQDLTEWAIGDFDPTDAILCRLNAPLVQLAMRFLRYGIPCKVLGRDIGAGLIAQIERATRKRVTPLDTLSQALTAQTIAEVRRHTARGDDAKAEAAQDRLDSILAIIEGLPDDATSADLIAHIRGMFADNAERGQVTLATIHKAKGLEWPRVFILDRSKQPPRWVKLPAQIEQEYNLLYVAYTRAKVDLRFVDLKAIN